MPRPAPSDTHPPDALLPDAPLPDAAANWVDRRAPARLRPWLRLGRFDRPVGIWLLLLPGWQGIALAQARFGQPPGWATAWLFLAFLAGAVLMRAAGCAFNDVVDRDIDRRVARTAGRPVASSRISVRAAWGFVVGCSLIAFLLLMTMNPWAIGLGVASTALVAAYPFMKRITWWPQAWLGLTFNWGALVGWAAAAPIAAAGFVAQRAGPGAEMGWTPGELAAPLLLYLGGVFWTLGYDTVYALQDIEDDALAGVRSSARRLGAGVARGVRVFYAAAVLLAGAAGAAAGLGPLFWLGLAAYAGHLAWQGGRVRSGDPAGALRLFRSNRDAGLILLAAVALGGIRF